MSRWSDRHGLPYLGSLGLTTSLESGATTTGLGLMNRISAARVEGSVDHNA
ncbi:hypothetical protein [Streptomyces sp. NPDC047046]|uniref:hypothetical protein n=1 Tax=Streptomyces sp. NPDC047046 TaxID=3155378 RepID=UPI0033FCC920